MKSLTALFILLFAFAGTFQACGDNGQSTTTKAAAAKAWPGTDTKSIKPSQYEYRGAIIKSLGKREYVIHLKKEVLVHRFHGCERVEGVEHFRKKGRYSIKLELAYHFDNKEVVKEFIDYYLGHSEVEDQVKPNSSSYPSAGSFNYNQAKVQHQFGRYYVIHFKEKINGGDLYSIERIEGLEVLRLESKYSIGVEIAYQFPQDSTLRKVINFWQ